MAEFLYASAHLAGDFENPTNAVGNTPSTWAGVLNNNQNRTSRWAIADPANPLTGAATQTVRVVARKGTNSNDPTVALNLYENGVLVQSILADITVTSTSGQTLVGTFNTSAVSNPANVEIEVVMTAAGGSPSARNSAQISHIEWEAATSVAAAEGTGAASLSVAASAAGSRIAKGTAASLLSASTAATGQRTAKGSGSASATVAATGAGSIPSTTAEGSGAATVTASVSASGTRIAKGTGAAAVAADAAGVGQRTAKGSGEANVAAATSAAGEKPPVGATGSGSSSVTVTVVGEGAVTHKATAVAAISIGADAAGKKTAKAAGVASVVVSVSAELSSGGGEALLTWKAWPIIPNAHLRRNLG